MQSRPANSLKDTVLLDAVASGFPSLDIAAAYGRKTRDAIAICCALLGMGVEIGKHEEFLDSSHVQSSDLDGQNYVQPSDLNGLVVYPQDAEVKYFGVTLSSKGGPPGEKFRRVFVKSFELCKNLDSRLGLAFELYNSCSFEVSTRAQFLQLISVIECLAKPHRQQSAIIDHLDELIVLSEKYLATIEEISEDDRNNFIQRLHHLKRESISSACRNLVRKYLGDEDAATFKECYNIRSKLTHEGETSPKVDLDDYHSKLSLMTRDLLYAMVSE